MATKSVTRNAGRLALALVGVLGLAQPAAAEDKSSTRPNVISVPSGPGSITGLGESFEANLNSGSVREAIKLAVPPGTAGMAPTLALSYDSGHGNGPVGIGWSLGTSSIQIQTSKGLPRYDGSDRVLLDGAELVPVGAGVYRPKIEGRFARVRRVSDHWEVDLPDGKRLIYGETAEARVGTGTWTFAWYLERESDRWGNQIVYTYVKDGGQPYLAQVDYNARAGAAANSVVFEYEGRSDVVTDCKARFCVATGKRLRLVTVYGHGELVRRYRLDYQETNGLSLLAAVTQIGDDDKSTLPPLRFWYSAFGGNGNHVTMQSVPARIPGVESGNDELVDVDGDGFPDLLHTETGAHWFYLNQGGQGFGARVDMPGCPSVELASGGAEVGDLNGDGLPDLINKSAGGGGSYCANHGDGQWQSSLAFTGAPAFGFEDPNVKMLDFDRDGRVDVVQWTKDGFNLWRNAGNGAWTGPTHQDLPPSFSSYVAEGFTDPRLKLADMNGDGLVDLVFVRQGSLAYWPSMGWGAFGSPVSIRVPAAVGNPGVEAEPYLMLADVNGDGLADLIWVDTDHVDVWPLLSWGGLGDRIRIGTPSHNRALTAVRLADMNGNGSVDIVWSTPSLNELGYLDLVGDVKPNLLVAEENGLGKQLQLAYTTSGKEYQRDRGTNQAWTTRVPFPVQVLGTSAVSDGLGHRHETQYQYRNGWYAATTREFRGFAQGIQIEQGDAYEATSVSIHQFDLGRNADGSDEEARKALPLWVESQTGNGQVLQRVESEFQLFSYPPGSDGTPVKAPRKVKGRVWHAEGLARANWVETLEELAYDDYGNVTQHWEWGIVQGETDSGKLAGDDERITTSEYVNNQAQWLLGRPIHQTVTDAQGNKLAESKTYYDGDAFQGLGYGLLGAQGVPTRTESWISGDHFAQTERVRRDAYGNVVATLDPLGARREVDYDTETHCFPVAERFLYGSRVLTFGASYNLAQGLLTSYRDAAGVETRFRWDALHHLAAIVRPGDSDDHPTLELDYVYANPISRVVQRAQVQSGRDDLIETDHLYDGLGRKLATIQDAEGGRTVVTGMRDLGIQGRVIREYEPFFAQGFALPGTPRTKYTAHVYDALGRDVRTVLPDGLASERHYAPLAVEHWDAEDLDPKSQHAGTPRTERFSALGVAQVEERLGTQTLTTRIARDAQGRIQSTTDALGFVSTAAYDGLGRKVKIDDPDAGTTHFDFDDAGNLRHRIDARGKIVATDYDGLGRPILERLLDAAGSEEEKVVFHYDDPSPLFPGNVATGKLAWVEDGAGEEHYRRDERGRLVESIRKVDGKSHHAAFAFDDLDRPIGRVFPDGRSLDYHFNPRGLLESVPGVISSIAYDERGLVARREHANGAVTAASYDDLARLHALVTESHGKTLQSLGYSYDQVGNLSAIDDALRATGPLSATRRAAYDDLYRLVSATGAGRSWSYAFNEVGDLTKKSDVGDYTYGKAHQVASAGGKSYRYDEAGNVVERPGAKLTFDAKGRLKAVALDDGTAVTYRYDHTGRRVVKESRGPRGNTKTVYVDEASEERDGQVIDYVMAGRTRLARLGGKEPTQLQAGILTRLPPAFTSLAAALLAMALLFWIARSRAPARAATALACAFSLLAVTTWGCGHSHGGGIAAIPATHYHGDHLGGTALLTNPDGNVSAEISYDPWGVEIVGATEPYVFTGKEYEADTGLYDYAARAYDPVLGRFLSPDPLVVFEPGSAMGEAQQYGGRVHNSAAGFQDYLAQVRRTPIGRSISQETYSANPAMLSRYSYGLDNPYKFVDPDGHHIEFAKDATKAFKGDFAAAVVYLNSKGAGQVLADLERSKTTVYIRDASASDKKKGTDFQYDPATMTITVDPRSGLKVKGGTQTPALGILHEAGHALQHVSDSVQFAKDVGTALPGWTTAEEKRVNEKVESPAAKKLGEPTRSDHYGVPVVVKCVTCDK